MFKFLNSVRGLQILCAILALLSIIAISFAFSQPIQKETPVSQAANDNHYTPIPSSSQETKDSASSLSYTVREYDGIIGVFQNDESVPCITENVKINTLPEEDKRIITQGVTFETYKEMIAFLQNYE